MKNEFDKVVYTLVKYRDNKKRAAFSLALLPLLGCGGEDNNRSSNIEENNDSQINDINNGTSYFELVANKANFGSIETKDIITATNNTFTTDTSLVDNNPYDDDELTVVTTNDITATPVVSGIEKITFTTDEISLGTDNEFNIDLLNISDFDTINFTNTNSASLVKSLDLKNADSNLFIGPYFSSATIALKENADLTLKVSNDFVLTTAGIANKVFLNANGKNLTLKSPATAKDLTISNANIVDVKTIAKLDDLIIVANGSVSLENVQGIEGNINVQSGGTVNIKNAGKAAGTLTLSNERAPSGSDIIINDGSSFGNVSINSVGSVNATDNAGLASAKFISVTAAEDSTLNADNIPGQEITLSALNIAGKSTSFTLNASSLEQLNLKGTSPIVVIVDGADISSEKIINTNTDATLWFSWDETDLTQVDTSVKLRLRSHDGNELTIKDSQDFYIDAEVAQTSSSSTPTFDHVTDATGSTSNAISLKTFDSNTANADKTVNVSGLKFTDIQIVNLKLLENIGIDSSADITGPDISSIVITGSGDFNLNTNTITGSASSRVTLNASNAEGAITLNLDSTINGVANIQTGSGTDNIKINGITSDSGGFVVNSGNSADTINITTAGDGPSAKINLNGGGGSDILILDAGVDLSASNLTLTSIENIKIVGGGVSQKIAASDVSGIAFKIYETGIGTGTLTVAADQTTINLSSLTFDSSFSIGTDSIIVDASSSASGVNITGTSGNDTITGSNANDTLNGGDSADIISGGTGNDIIVGGNGGDTLSGGAGDDEFDFTSGTSTEATMDKITDYQADAADKHNDTIDNITGKVGTNTTNIDVKTAIAGGGGGETVKAAVNNGIVTLTGANAGSIDTLAEWIDAVSVDGVIAVAADDADSTGTVAFLFNGNTYIVESNDAFNNNTPNVNIVSVIELTGVTGINAVSSDAAAASTILIA